MLAPPYDMYLSQLITAVDGHLTGEETRHARVAMSVRIPVDKVAGGFLRLHIPGPATITASLPRRASLQCIL